MLGITETETSLSWEGIRINGHSAGNGYAARLRLLGCRQRACCPPGSAFDMRW
jgi:hypothetical protein